ncbi:5-formyltetrahydrofolate cyclo-ligase [Paenibacillus sp. HW567]|uniref:5-formyltetrahydrofolate cyclo-ligase n=1 Tax=Paenibacillus sp. HW567 TaxID=1034769 RepID=UPI00038102B0|nr:5-formyltetrahydrofolate cyclo-ligase [Paenibacillus sp. HW567]
MTGNTAPLAGLKRELRAERIAVRDRLPQEERAALSALACKHAWEWLEMEGAASLLAYVPFRSELDCRPLVTEAWAQGREVRLPRVNAAAGTMSFHAVRSWEELEPGAYGILEPSAAGGGLPETDDPRLPDVVFVPGLAFDIKGGRLGYGRGYYDRLRASWEQRTPLSGKSPVWIGLAFGEQLVSEVPMDDHDAYMDMLITEDGIFHCRKEHNSWS